MQNHSPCHFSIFLFYQPEAYRIPQNFRQAYFSRFSSQPGNLGCSMTTAADNNF